MFEAIFSMPKYLQFLTTIKFYVVSNFSLCDCLLYHFNVVFTEVLVTILYEQPLLFIFGFHEFYYNVSGHNFI